MFFLKNQELFQHSIDTSYLTLTKIAEAIGCGNRIQLAAEFLRGYFAHLRYQLPLEKEMEFFQKITPFFQYLYTAPISVELRSLENLYRALSPQIQQLFADYYTFVQKLHIVRHILIEMFDFPLPEIPTVEKPSVVVQSYTELTKVG